jgi:structural protein KPP10_ORF10
VAEWDPTKFIIVVGANVIQEFAAGTFIKAEHNEDQYSLEIGADGRGARIRNANESGTYEITLLKSSPSNDLLAALAILDRQTGQGVVPVQVKDGNGAAVANSQNAWVRKQPGLERGKELGDVTWVLETDKLELAQGGFLPLGQ